MQLSCSLKILNIRMAASPNSDDSAGAPVATHYQQELLPRNGITPSAIEIKTNTMPPIGEY